MTPSSMIERGGEDEFALPRVSVTPESLEALAARCEREEPGWSLDHAIAEAMGWTLKADGHFLDWYTPEGVTGPHIGPPTYTTSLDAAVTLVPAAIYGGKTGEMTTAVHQADDGRWWAELRNGWQTSFDKAFIGVAKTEPMARCAAALRARAVLSKPERR